MVHKRQISCIHYAIAVHIADHRIKFANLLPLENCTINQRKISSIRLPISICITLGCNNNLCSLGKPRDIKDIRIVRISSANQSGQRTVSSLNHHNAGLIARYGQRFIF